ncbi:MAG TPA: cytochrome C biogenesis protein [Prolixibacteraceae bacterium]|nr:cytochrome C biogenesis protein [Prolixibacteraceae bacterium]
MKKFSSFFFSMLSSVLLMIIFGAAIAYATFIENDYGTNTARILIYDSWWFELLLFVLCINLTGSVFRYKLVRRKKWPVLLFHLAFIVMIIGAGITRYTSDEGSMHIREGSSSDEIISEETFVSVVAESGTGKVSVIEKVMFSPYTTNRFLQELEIAGKRLSVKNNGFVPNAIETAVADESGQPILSFIFFGEDFSRQDFNLEQGQFLTIGNLGFSFGSERNDAAIRVNHENGTLTFTATDTLIVSSMTGNEKGQILSPDEIHPLEEKSVYQINKVRFVLKTFYPKAKLKLIYVPEHSGKNLPDAFAASVRSGNEEKIVHVFGQKGVTGEYSKCFIDGVSVSVSYGSLARKLPFSIHLDDFQLERYPGSHSPSSFASEVKIMEAGTTEAMSYRIFMNNILNYRGYRFFQSSYDEDEKGTILSVSHDWWGTAISYLGYFLLTFGMVMTLFGKNSRFRILIRASSKLKQLRMKSTVIIFGILLASGNVLANVKQKIDDNHLYSFGELLVQDKQGRIEPVNTLASEVLRKLSKKNSYSDMPAAQVFLLMNVYPEHWKNQPIIKISNDELKKLLGINSEFASWNQLVGKEQGYLLSEMVDAAYKKKPTLRNKLDKEVINVDERVNICYQVFQRDFLKAYPVPGDSTNTWLLPGEFAAAYDSIGSELEKISLNTYFQSVAASIDSGDWQKSDEILQNIKNYQREFGAGIVPSEQKVRLEIFYNEKNIFRNLAFACVILGFVLLVLHFVQIFKPNLYLGKILFSATYLLCMVFVIYTAGLAIRWYISGHAPWSNGYETMIYIGWATLLSGFVFVKRSPITLAVTTVLTGIILFVAGMSWMNPEITNLVPVLKSYWLIVHVAIITASYGFLAIGALLGLINLILMVLRNGKNLKNTTFSITELAYIIEMTLIIGVMLLTIGAFIGAVWANESWGRYWGWDPKETWALVTILVYSVILHLKKIPGMKSSLVLSTFSLLGFSSVLMTFFGVNYYLSGMHSYAQGDPPPIPAGVYWAILVIAGIIVLAFVSEKKYGKLIHFAEFDNMEE